MIEFNDDKLWEGEAYYEGDGSDTVRGFSSVSVESVKDNIGVIVSNFAYDQPDHPMSISVHLSVEAAREYAQQILLACNSEEEYAKNPED